MESDRSVGGNRGVDRSGWERGNWGDGWGRSGSWKSVGEIEVRSRRREEGGNLWVEVWGEREVVGE